MARLATAYPMGQTLTISVYPGTHAHDAYADGFTSNYGATASDYWSTRFGRLFDVFNGLSPLELRFPRGGLAGEATPVAGTQDLVGKREGILSALKGGLDSIVGGTLIGLVLFSLF